MLCPETESLEGKLALVTGGNRGIGLEITKGLARRGADVIVAARGNAGTLDECRQISADTGRRISFLSLDLADKDSIADAVLEYKWQGQHGRIDIFCANAGVSATKYSRNCEDIELCFAVNCLGHQRLFDAMMESDCLAQNARIIITTGDIYVLAEDCTPDFSFRGRSVSAYSRSKLGNLWQHYEIARRHPKFVCVAVHPGVVATELEGKIDGIVGFFKRRLMISPFLGAQATLIAATQDLPSGTYFHNKLGKMELCAGDEANNSRKRSMFWEALSATSR
jgi:NAD(P)-dependent dehydrogenase (short-subunit alcohol dehydrogenase family)